MNRDLVQHLVCPMCRGELQLSARETHDQSVESGSVECQQCISSFRIDEGVIDLLPTT